MSKITSRKREAFHWVKIYTPLFVLALICGRFLGATPDPVGTFGYYKSTIILMCCFYGFSALYIWGLAFISTVRSKHFRKELVK